MSIFAYIEEVESLVSARRDKMPRHQATVYAIEQVVERHLPSQVVARRHAQAWLDAVCAVECWDTPTVESIRTKRWAGVASAELNVIGISTAQTTAVVLAHELAHIVCGEHGHDECWRHAFVQIVRDHVSIEHASLLHTLYGRFNLEAGQWRLTSKSITA